MTFVISAFQMYVLHFGHFFENRKNSGLTPGQNDDPVTRTRRDPNDPLARWPNDTVPCLLSAIISLELHVRSSPDFLCMLYMDCGSVLLWQRSDALRISGFTDDAMFAHKLRLLDVAARLRQWGSHAAFGLVHRKTRCRQRTGCRAQKTKENLRV